MTERPERGPLVSKKIEECLDRGKTCRHSLTRIVGARPPHGFRRVKHINVTIIFSRDQRYISVVGYMLVISERGSGRGGDRKLRPHSFFSSDQSNLLSALSPENRSFTSDDSLRDRPLSLQTLYLLEVNSKRTLEKESLIGIARDLKFASIFSMAAPNFLYRFFTNCSPEQRRRENGPLKPI
jgi:hypothetical protein